MKSALRQLFTCSNLSLTTNFLPMLASAKILARTGASIVDGRRSASPKADYVDQEVPDRSFFGFGIDYRELGRNFLGNLCVWGNE
jgi:hypothetical protein